MSRKHSSSFFLHQCSLYFDQVIQSNNVSDYRQAMVAEI